MSIHQSKGLEFPLVVVADLGKKFNTADLRAEVILDEAYGLCPLVKPPTTGKRYPSLAHWLGSRRQLQELLGEELRLLDVATTRARDLLLLTGTITKSKLAKTWAQRPESPRRPPATHALIWIGCCSGFKQPLRREPSYLNTDKPTCSAGFYIIRPPSLSASKKV